MNRTVFAVVAALTLGGCALKGDVRRVEDQLATFREETARADSARALVLAGISEDLDLIEVVTRSISDSLAAQRQTVFSLQGLMRGELTEIQRQLLAIQELFGQNQARLNELRRQLGNTPGPQPVVQQPSQPGQEAQPLAPPPPPRPEAGPGPEDLFELGVQQLRRGSPQAGRTVFRRLLSDFPDHERAADAVYWIGESFRQEEPDSAVYYFERVASQFPESPRSPQAIYRIGLDAERRGDDAQAREAFNRVVANYPRSPEAELARQKLRPSP
ncbi:MAG: tetratricopeptide repeat protein [Gemmatimonadota bacterium]|nr:tetratricopeptide repeat protein [Gemmatimonadota bacterium]MDH5804517.1 tetratricopeptide repeat protein [Gemmatimonadota bacterium]